jgi:uncharacterized protein (TIGR03086 family)
MSTEPLEAAIRSTRAVLAGTTADDLGKSTPCASWQVSDLINHIVGGLFFFAGAMSGEAPPAGEAPDFSAGDFHATFEQASAACLAAFHADGAMQKMVALPFGTMPGAAVVGIAASDVFTHGWDLARATGQSTDLDAQLAADLLAAARGMISDEIRGPDPVAPFAPATAAPSGATAADELAAFLGRSV